MTAPLHQLILASAGTGKTYRLTNRYLGLLLQGVDPARILATTFTRKAAGEILDRVLERLVDATATDAGLADLRRALGRRDLTAADCDALLARLTRQLGRVQVRTIDSFFVHLARLFGLDLALPPEWGIASEPVDAELRAEAIHEVLAIGSTAERVDLLRELQRGTASRRVQETMLERIRAGRVAFLESAADAWDRVRVDAMPTDGECAAAIEQLQVAGLPTNRDGSPGKRWVRARDQLVSLWRARDWQGLLGAGLGGSVFSGDCTYYKTPIPQPLLDALMPLVRRATGEVAGELRRRNQATRQLLEHFEVAYAERKARRGAYRFEDLPLALAPRTAAGLPLDERELDLWFRLDGRIDHLLLDEFQDTAPIQWRILAPMAEEICADGSGERSFFCVGDVKQSIYGFRQAEPRLLAELDQQLPGLAVERMELSYRSAPVVLGTVNELFRGVASNPAFDGDGLQPHREAARAWQAGFDEHRAARDLPGCAFLIEAPPATDEQDDFAPVLATVLRRVARIRAEAPTADIGILMRERKRIPAIIHALRQHGIDASGEGGNPLTDSEAVQAFLSLLQLADHPDDSAALFHLAHTPFRNYLQLPDDDDPAGRHQLSRALRQRCADEGLDGLTAAFAAEVQAEPAFSPWDKLRFGQLLDLAHGFTDDSGLRPAAFGDHVRQQRVEAPGGSPVRVMTIHAAKGLEFAAVILPELDKKLVGQRDALLTLRPTPFGPITMVSNTLPGSLLAIDPALQELYETATRRAVEDALCNLYVATTRAARRLEMILPAGAGTRPTTAPTAAGLVRHALPTSEPAADDADRVIWCHPDNAPGASWAEGLQDAGTATAAPLPPPPFRLAASRAPRRLPTRSPSATAEGGTVTAADLLGPAWAARRGTLIHAWLEGLEWLEDFSLDEAAMRATGDRLGATPAACDEAIEFLRSALQHDEIQRALSRRHCPVRDARPEVRNEHGFALVLPAADDGAPDELWRGAVDRLVLARRGEEVIYAEVSDYKTDAVTDAEIPARIEHYRSQLDHYRRIVARQTGLDPAAVVTRLVFLAPGRVADLPWDPTGQPGDPGTAP